MKKGLSLIILFSLSLISLVIFANNKTELKKENLNEKSNKLLAIYVNDELKNEMPTTNKYDVSAVCKDKQGNVLNNITVSAKWVSNKWNIELNNILNGTTRCNLYFTDKEAWEGAPEGTLLAAIQENATVNSDSGLTIPGQDLAINDEGLRMAEDDYGTSYYFRGAVNNNYVVFAKMCWRIVRIDGAGNIKLVLYNYNSNKTSVTNPCESTYDATDAAFARYSRTTFTSRFGSSTNAYTRNAYVGFMYGTVNAATYEATHANNVSSGVLTNLKTWYNNNINDYSNVLADTIWCNDKRLNKDNDFNPYNYSNVKNSGIKQEETYYAGAKRLFQSGGTSSTDYTGVKPSLKCGDTKSDNMLSKFTASTTTDDGYGNGALNGYKIGLLTADEVAFAGARYYSTNNQSDNTSYYLHKNASSTFWWTMTPFSFHNNNANEFIVNSSGVLTLYSVYNSYALRPAITLKSNVIASTSSSENIGTASNPYLVSNQLLSN